MDEGKGWCAMSNATLERPKVTDPKLIQDIERAKAAAKARQTAPAIALKDLARQIPQKVLLNEHMTRNGYNKAEYHAMWGDRTRHDRYLEQGYIPVPDANGRHAVGEGGDLLYVLPRDLHERGIALAAEESRRQLRQTDAAKDAKKAGIEDGAVDERINVKTVKGNSDAVAKAARSLDLTD
jgi:hypothetical protein